ncbi:MAG: polysaccharide pyruvyl transferase family protein [Phycisphaerales bacterium]
MLNALARFAASSSAPRAPHRSGDLVVAPGRHGSIGDAAMLIGLRQLLADGGTDEPWIAAPVSDRGWDSFGRRHAPDHIPTKPGHYFGWRAPARSLQRVFLIGADVLDGRYSVKRSIQRLDFCGFCASLGAEVTITGFSLRDDTPPRVARSLRGLPPGVRLCARDPISLGRIERLAGRPAIQTADLAFLVTPDPAAPRAREALEWIASRKSRGATVFALCPNSLAIRRDDPRAHTDPTAREAECAGFFADVVQRVRASDPDADFVIVAHDRRSPHDDDAICARIARELGPSRSLLVPSDACPREIKAIMAACDGLLSGRMHCGIAALGAGTPAALLDYQGKVQGLLELFGLESSIMVGDDLAAAAERAALMLGSFRAEADAIRARIAARLPHVMRLSATNVA